MHDFVDNFWTFPNSIQRVHTTFHCQGLTVTVFIQIMNVILILYCKIDLIFNDEIKENCLITEKFNCSGAGIECEEVIMFANIEKRNNFRASIQRFIMDSNFN